MVDLKVSGSRITAVGTRGGEKIDTSKVVDAANAWANRIDKMAGVELPIRPVRSQVLTLERSTRTVWSNLRTRTSLPR